MGAIASFCIEDKLTLFTEVYTEVGVYIIEVYHSSNLSNCLRFPIFVRHLLAVCTLFHTRKEDSDKMRNLIRQVRRQPGFHTINEDNNPNATRSLSDREFLLGASKRDGGDSSLQDNTTTFVRDMCIVIRSCWKSGLLVGSCCGMLAFAVVILQSHDHGNPMRSSSSAIDKGWMGSLHGWMGRQPQHSSVSVVSSKSIYTLFIYYLFIWLLQSIYTSFNTFYFTPQATSRPIPTAQQQASMRDMYMRASVTLVPSEKEDTKEGMKKKDVRTVVLQGGSQKAGDAGHINLPLSFYEGIHFGVSAWNPWANVSRLVCIHICPNLQGIMMMIRSGFLYLRVIFCLYFHSVSENSKRDAGLRKAMEDILISDSSVVYNA